MVAANVLDCVAVSAAMLAAPAWLRSRRARYRPAGYPLRDFELAAFEPFFDADALASVRVARVEEFRPWPLEGLLRRVGFAGILPSSTVAGIALIDTVVIVTPAAHEQHVASLPLLFHELVHVEQYRALGVRGFLREYIGGWLAADRCYDSIPLEMQAFSLTDRYESAPGEPFSVAEAVRAHFGRG